jgi:hypothetical protein
MQPVARTYRSLIFVRYSAVEALIMAQRGSKSTINARRQGGRDAALGVPSEGGIEGSKMALILT